MDDLPNPFTNAQVIQRGANPADYHNTGKDYNRGDEQFIMSNGHLRAFSDCPAKWRAGGEVEEKSWQMDFGSWLDCLFLSPHLAEKCFAVTPATYPATPKRKGEQPEDKPWTRQANYCKEWEAEQEANGRHIIKHDVNDAVHNAMTSLREASATLQGQSDHQVFCMAEWRDKDTGIVVPIKTLVDLVPDLDSRWPKCLFDLKSTGNGSPGAWSKQIFDKGYYLQAALYMDVYTAATGEDRTDFAHIVIENTWPFHVTQPMPSLSAEFINLGRLRYRSALRQYCQCLESNEWPSYPLIPGTTVSCGLQILGPKPWMVMDSPEPQTERPRAMAMANDDIVP